MRHKEENPNCPLVKLHVDGAEWIDDVTSGKIMFTRDDRNSPWSVEMTNARKDTFINWAIHSETCNPQKVFVT
jgi:hypothetical protein